MKKRLVCMLMAGMMITGMVSGCGDKTEIADTQVAESVSVTQTAENDELGTDAADNVQGLQSETPAENFKTKILEDGTIEIEGYTGDSEALVIPAQIDGKDVTVIGGFANHDEITSVVIPDTVKEVSDKAFQNCFGITSVKMGANVEIIGDYAFSGKFEEIELPETLKVIGKNVFYCQPFKVLNIPEQVEEIGVGAFHGISIESLTIPGNVKTIEQQAFSSCEQLENVVIEEGVESIGQAAFEYCESLKTVTIPSSVTEIDDVAFIGSTNVTIIAEPGSYAEEYANRKKIPVQNP